MDEEQMESIPIDLIPVLMDEEQMESIPIDLIPVLIPVPIYEDNEDAVSAARFVPIDGEDAVSADQERNSPILKFFK
jgi:hypothetical protein